MATILIVTVGTRGDVVPYVTLGSALRDIGHRIVVATHTSLRSHVDSAGLGFVSLPVEFSAGPDTRPLTARRFARVLAGRWLEIGRAVAAASEEADLLVLGGMGWIGYHVAEARKIPSIGVFLQPLDPTREFPPPLLTTRSLGAWGNKAAARSLRLLGQLPFARQTAALRQELGLPAADPAAVFRRMEAEHWPVLYAFSPTVVPTPPDWPAWRRITGYLWPRAGTGLSPALQNFLDDGDPPVYIGLGSMSPPGAGDLISRTLTLLGRRVVVQRGAAGLSAGQQNVLVVDDEPHAVLFPRVAVAVHHAGAGTTAAALRAGTPSVCLPFTADQPFWAQRVAAIGAGSPLLHRRALTPERLAAAISSAGDYRAGAALIGARLATEDGVGQAVTEIERRLQVQ
ncbi:MAG TPA: glycosyltransferase [Actinoplanes sp.]|nr:glycosyltransferase [Actinoplanes sp.]